MIPGAKHVDRNTHLAGRRLILARAAWIIGVLLIVSIFFLALPSRMGELYEDPYQFQPVLERWGLGLGFFIGYATLLDLLFVGSCLAVAFLIAWRKSEDWVGLLVSLALLFFIILLPVVPALARTHPSWQPLILAFRLMGLLVILLVFYQFPDGRFEPHWTRYLMIFWTILFISFLFIPGYHVPAAPIDIKTWEEAAILLVLLVSIGTGVFAQLYRYARTTSAVQRQQTKWVVFGFTSVFGGLALITLPVIFLPNLRTGMAGFFYVMLDIPISLASWFLLPLSLTISILRYHLWDIDLLIRRTLVYGVLTILLAGCYYLGVALIQTLIQAATKQNQSSLAIVGSTLVIAALFSPLRQRIQEEINQRFYRQRYDAENMLKGFSRTVRDDVELERLSEHLLGVVEETFHPDQVSLWIYRSNAEEQELQAVKTPGKVQV